MMFTYIASGGLMVGGTTGLVKSSFYYTAKGSLYLHKCGIGVIFTPTPYCYHRFNPGDSAYLGYKAVTGILEYIVIKKLKLITFYGGHCIVMYVDTFNALYNEWDLINSNAATALINDYNLKVQQDKAKAECLK